MNTPANGPQRPFEPRTPTPASTETSGAENEAHSGVQRVRLDDLNSDRLDALYARLDRARDAAALHRQELITSAELYAAIEAPEGTYSTWPALVEAARALHKPMQRGSGVYCAHCSHWDGRRVLGVLTDYPCDTLRALDGPPQPHTGPTEAPQDGPVAPSAPRSTPGGVSDPAQRHEPSDGHTATQDGLRAQVKAALRLTPRTGHTDWPPPSPHGGPDGHLYDMRCALCGSDVNALADAVLSVRDAELARLRAELAKLRAVSRGYCPHCGRGDCAPRLEDWEHERARAEQAEAAIARVRETAERWRYVHDRKQASEELRAALNPPKENQP